MKKIDIILEEVKNFVAIESGIVGFPDMWGFEHADEYSSLFIIKWLKERNENRQVILNITPSEKSGTFDVQLINVGKIEILNKKQVSISEDSKLVIQNYSKSHFNNQVFLMPFGDPSSIHHYIKDIEIIPNKILL